MQHQTQLMKVHEDTTKAYVIHIIVVICVEEVGPRLVPSQPVLNSIPSVSWAVRHRAQSKPKIQ